MKKSNIRRNFEKIRHNVKKTTNTIKSLSPISLSVIAVIAIIWYLVTSYNVTNNWWFLPLIAVSTGVLAIILPILCDKFKVLNSIIATGFAILLLETLKSFMIVNYVSIACSLTLVALITESLVNKKISTIGNSIIDICICIVTSVVFLKLQNPIFVLILLLICYIVVLISNFKISLSLRRFKITNNNPIDTNQE